jgi:Holliday junction resolvasome RuvABC ATP-dependent DNA helicase subunit
LFIGNPGCGKTTVAELIAAAMVELGFRKNPKPVLTNAGDILKEKDPAGVFKDLVEEAENGTVSSAGGGINT